MIDAQSGVAAKGVPEIFPEREDPLIGELWPKLGDGDVRKAA
jgi:hypothetical protein